MLSDTEIAFILPSLSPGVHIVVVQLVDAQGGQCGGNASSGSASSSSSGVSSNGNVTAAGSDGGSSITADNGNGSGSSGGSSTGVVRSRVPIRSDRCGGGGGWLRIRDRRMRDIQLYFAPAGNRQVTPFSPPPPSHTHTLPSLFPSLILSSPLITNCFLPHSSFLLLPLAFLFSILIRAEVANEDVMTLMTSVRVKEHQKHSLCFSRNTNYLPPHGTMLNQKQVGKILRVVGHFVEG